MFEKFSKIPRLNKEVVITEKLDGTNAQINIVHVHQADQGTVDAAAAHPTTLGFWGNGSDIQVMMAGSRNRYLTLDDDNFGFAHWVEENAVELFKFGPGRHFGEWWGQGIQRTYGLEEKRFSMFNPRWADQGPDCVSTVPVLLTSGDISSAAAYGMSKLATEGSHAAPGFMNPEGIIVYHSGSRQLFKQTFEYDEGKWGGVPSKGESWLDKIVERELSSE
jgi:hypothetical protein